MKILLVKETLTVYGNLPYNISTEILIKWILNMKEKKIWFNYLHSYVSKRSSR